MMDLSNLSALYSGLAYLAAAGVCIPIIKILGPAHPTRITAPPWLIGFAVFYMAVLFFRSMTILFPGEIVSVATISWVTPLKATGDLCLVIIILDLVLRYRAPPPLFGRLMQLAARNGVSDKGLREMAFAAPAVATPHGPTASEDPDNIQIGGRKTRLTVLGVSGAVVVIIVAFVVLNSAAAMPA